MLRQQAGQAPKTGPALLQLDQDALNRVFAKLEPEALALAGAPEHSAGMLVCAKTGPPEA